VSEDDAVIQAMIDAYRAEANRTRPFKAPAGWNSYGDWVSYECFAAVLAAVRRFS
jgi:hypothetical protein